MAKAGNGEVQAAVTRDKSERCRGSLSSGVRPVAYLRARKICSPLSKKIPKEHNRPCPQTTP